MLLLSKIIDLGVLSEKTSMFPTVRAIIHRVESLGRFGSDLCLFRLVSG
ncbi:hypothetical protein CCP2SC5_660014 [Azospirillaceae bacterium]